MNSVQPPLHLVLTPQSIIFPDATCPYKTIIKYCVLVANRIDWSSFFIPQFMRDLQRYHIESIIFNLVNGIGFVFKQTVLWLWPEYFFLFQ